MFIFGTLQVLFSVIFQSSFAVFHPWQCLLLFCLAPSAGPLPFWSALTSVTGFALRLGSAVRPCVVHKRPYFVVIFELLLFLLFWTI